MFAWFFRRTNVTQNPVWDASTLTVHQPARPQDINSSNVVIEQPKPQDLQMQLRGGEGDDGCGCCGTCCGVCAALTCFECCC
ncbi:hypothetical protein CBS63078_11090 [Aspergillus niger]|nr:hypothetical protein CBS63078_11090 [Aspergillus niger]KAI2946381.1 hypothetical protein CBS147323_11260 [Aspergillus niger]KAI2983826.1 hypothetical protein CBS147345_11152 [Aspergillus niger]KAI3015365.1 hypothetical protein CBS147347_11212 [Aspergillus niger]KAI3071514.1 hypothetical protein CBS147353_6420 [Aspergillus niger]